MDPDFQNDFTRKLKKIAKVEFSESRLKNKLKQSSSHILNKQKNNQISKKTSEISEHSQSDNLNVAKAKHLIEIKSMIK